MSSFVTASVCEEWSSFADSYYPNNFMDPSSPASMSISEYTILSVFLREGA